MKQILKELRTEIELSRNGSKAYEVMEKAAKEIEWLLTLICFADDVFTKNNVEFPWQESFYAEKIKSLAAENKEHYHGK